MTPAPEPAPPRPPEVDAHYAAGAERGRLAGGVGRLELARTQELLRRYLPSPPAVVAAEPAVLGVSAHILAVARK